MKLQSQGEVLAAIDMIQKDDSSEFILYGSTVQRSELLIAIFMSIKDLNLDTLGFLVHQEMLRKEYLKYHYQIWKYEFDSDCWQSCGPIKGKFLSIDQAYSKLIKLDTKDNSFWYQIKQVN